MLKKVACLFFILSFIIMMVGCGGVPTAPPIISSELVIVRVTDPKSNLISVAGKVNEDAMAILGDKDTEGNPTSITGAVYVLEQGDPFGIDAGRDGLPTYLIDSEGNKVIFENYTNSTVDISLYNSNGDLIQEPIIINVDSADLLELKQLYNSFYSQQKSWGKNVANDVATGLRWGAKAIPWVACTITGGALYFAPFTVLYPPISFAAYACISTVIFTAIEVISPPSFSFTEYEEEAVTAEGCSSSELVNPLACVSTIYNVLAYGIEQGFGTNYAPIISSLTANPSSININGTTTITCTASDENIGDTLTYTWTKTDGTFEGSTTGATVTWRAPSTADTYTITCEVSDGEGNDSKSVAVTVNDPGSINHSPDITSTAITSATKGQPYSYNVDAIDSDGDTLTYSLTTKPSGMAINSSTGLITWTPTTSGNYNVTVKVSDVELFDTQSFTVTVEENGTSLVPPTGLSVSSSWNTTSPGFPSMALSWNAVSGATGYDMWVRPSGGSSVSLGTRDAPYVTFNSNSLPGGVRYVSGTTYYFKVCTVTASGTSGFTSEVPCVAAAAPSSSTSPVAPSMLSATTLSQNNIALTWQDNSNDEIGFKIERKTGTTGIFNQIAIIEANAGTGSGVYYEDIGLIANTTYCYRVRAYNIAGNSSYSNEICATTNPSTILPTAITGLATNITSNSATLNGTVNPNGVATGAFFQWGTTTSYGNLTTSQVLGSGINNINISSNLSGLLSNTTYHFRIVATNSNSGTTFGGDQLFTTTYGTQNVTLVLYICENSTSGTPLSGVSVGISDGGGNSFSQTTNSSGYVTITGIPGTWSFSAMKSGYDTNSWSQSITTNCTKYGYIVKSATPIGTIDVFATLNGSAWIGSLSYSLTGSSSSSGSTVPAVLSNKPVGSYSITFNSGGPSNASLSSITPSSTQTLSTGGITTFTFNFTGSTLGQVQLSSPSNGATLPPMNVTFIWNSVSNATKYQFILYNQQGGIALDATNSSTFSIVALGTEETITWKIRAGDNSGNWGPWSDTWSLIIKK